MIRKTILCSWLLIAAAPGLMAQEHLRRSEAIELALLNNPQVQLANLRIEKQRVLLPATFNPNQPELIFEAPTGNGLRPGVLQSFAYPGVYTQQRKAQQTTIRLSEQEKALTSNQLRYQVRVLYNEWLYQQEVLRNYRKQDSLLADFVKVTDVRLNVGQISRIERLNAETQYKEVQYLLGQTRSRLRSTRIQLALLTGRPADTLRVPADPFQKEMLQLPDLFGGALGNNPLLVLNRTNEQLSNELLRLEKRRQVPGLVVGYLNQGSDATTIVDRMRFGVSLPVWSWFNRSRIKGAEADVAIARQQINQANYELQGALDKALSDFRQYNEALNYYESIGLQQADAMIEAARDGYRLGSIGYYNYLLNVQQAFKIQLGYLEVLRHYNESVYTIWYLTAQ
jgi:outer membrane protein TolC